MIPVSRADVVLGLLAILAGAIIVPMSLALPSLPQSYAGPSLFPSLIGCLFILAGVVITINGLRAWRAEKAGQGDEASQPRPQFAWRRMIEVLIAVAVFIIVAPRLGFVVGGFVLVAGMLLIRGNRWTTSVAVALILTIIVRWIFVSLLKVPLPVGPWGW